MPQTYTFASWNVNGLRAVLKKDPSFIQIAQELDVDILALQETKLQEGQVDIDLAGYNWTPIGGTTASTAFKGSFDGKNHTVKNMGIYYSATTTAAPYKGLFGYCLLYTSPSPRDCS